MSGFGNLDCGLPATSRELVFMRHIGELNDDSQALVFAAYLKVQGIESQIDPQSGGGAEIWIKDEDQFDDARRELKSFQDDPSNSKYSESVQIAKTLVRDEEKKRKQLQKKIIRVGAGTNRRRPPLTLTLIGLCVLVALITNFGDRRKTPRDHSLYQALQFTSVGPPASLDLAREISGGENSGRDDLRLRLASVRRGEIWRMVTPIFIHYSIWHLAFNMYWLFLFGSMIENRYGALKLGALILGAAALSNLLQCTVPIDLGGMWPAFAPGSDVLITQLGGMSGVVYGLFGFVWMKMVHDRKSGFRIPQSTIVILMIWLFLCMVPDLFPNIDLSSNFILRLIPTNVANWAHGVGLLVGLAVGYVTSVIRR